MVLPILSKGKYTVEVVPDEASNTIIASEEISLAIDEANLCHIVEEADVVNNTDENEPNYYREFQPKSYSNEKGAKHLINYWMRESYKVDSLSFHCNLFSIYTTPDMNNGNNNFDYIDSTNRNNIGKLQTM